MISECIKNIYWNLKDEQSKMIYINRVNYSLTGDLCFIDNMINQTVRQNPKWISFCNSLKTVAQRNDMVIFGAGIWGNILYNETCAFVKWKTVVDSNLDKKGVGRLLLLPYERFAQEYKGEIVVISSFKNYKSMRKQLKATGIPDDKILDAGTAIFELTEGAIYFDLDKHKASKEKEVFIDAGGFDGLTSVQFMNWCGRNGYSYIFEPDEKNISLIRNNLKEILNYEIIPKALWSSTTVLGMNAKGDFSTTVGEIESESVEEQIKAVSLDEFVGDRKVTFIKMDIEGAELEALKGAKKLIREQSPRLAVSIYHKPEDIWTIPALIYEYNSNYRFYLRHYSFSYYDTVLYAIAEER